MSERFWNVVSLQGNRDTMVSFRNQVCSKGRDMPDRVLDLERVFPVPSSLRIPYGPMTLLSYYAYRVVSEGRKSVESVYWERYLYRLYLKERERFSGFVTDYPSYIRYCDKYRRHGIRLGLGKVFGKNLSLYGFGTAVEWMQENWGTVSNSYDGEHLSVSKFAFAVNGGIPFHLYQRLSEQFPDLLLTVRYAGDFEGRRSGFFQYYGGKRQCFEEYSMSDRFPVIGSRALQLEQGDITLLRWKVVMGCRGVPFSVSLLAGGR